MKEKVSPSQERKRKERKKEVKEERAGEGGCYENQKNAQNFGFHVIS
jgi:hypothetical protein